MNNEELKSALTSLEPSVVFEEGGEWLNVFVEPGNLKPLALKLKSELKLDYLFSLTCVDWKTHLTMVYHLRNSDFQHTIVLKSKLDREKPEVETVCDIWRTAEFHEREVYDLFGVKFIHHPDLRRLLLTDDWQGWPLRKDYEDPVNMIKL